MPPEPLSDVAGLDAAVEQDDKLRFDPNLINTYQKAGGTLSNGAIPSRNPVSIITSEDGDRAVSNAQMTETRLTPPIKDTAAKSKIDTSKTGITTGTTKTDTAVSPPAASSEISWIEPKTGRTFKTNASTDQNTLNLLKEQGFTIFDGTGNVPTSKSNFQTSLEKGIQDDEAVIKTYSEKLQNFNVSDDPVLQAQVSAISAAWEARKSEMQRVNQSRVAAMETTGIRLGSRYTGGVRGGVMGSIITEEERQGVDRIGELESKKQAALSEARSAYGKEQWDKYVELIGIAEKSAIRQREQLNKINEAQAKQDAEIQKENREIARNTKLGDMLDEEMKDGSFNREAFLSKASGLATVDEVNTFLDNLQKQTSATSVDFNDLTATLGRPPSLKELVDYRQQKTKPTVREYSVVAADGKLHRYRDIMDASGSVIASTDLGETTNPQLTLLRDVDIANKTGVTSGQLVHSSSGLPVTTGNQAMRDRVIQLKGLQDRSNEIKQRIDSGLDTGAIKGWVTFKGVKIPAIQETLNPELLTLQAELTTLFSRYVYAMTGSQVNELEFDLAQRTTPSISGTPENNKAILKGFDSNVKNQIDSILKGEGWGFAGSSSGKSSSNATGATVREGKTSSGNTFRITEI